MALQSLGPSLFDALAGGMTRGFQELRPADLTQAETAALLWGWAVLYLKAALPVIGVILAVGLLAGLIQGNFLFSFNQVVPDFSRMNPVTGFGRVFSLRTLVELVKGLLKLAVVGAVAYRDISAALSILPRLMYQSVAMGVTTMATLAVSGLQHIGYGLMALGILDYGYQYWEFRKSVRMTKQEVKQEHKQQEGNPERKQKIRQKQREMARRRRAIKDVPLADVVITNPTHFAVAIRYQVGEESAPRVIAKGTDLLAQRIKVIAKNHQIPTVEDRPLARTLYATVEVGSVVPPELYQAVAEVLAFVYSLRRQQRYQGPLSHKPHGQEVRRVD